MGLHIGFHETMSGTYERLTSNPIERRFEFTVTASAPLRQFINPNNEQFLVTSLEGVVSMDGFCQDAPIQNGTLSFGSPDLSIDYYFEFEARGSYLVYEGSKSPNLKKPIESMTTMQGLIREHTGWKINLFGSITYFDLKDLPSFLLSFLQGLKLK